MLIGRQNGIEVYCSDALYVLRDVDNAALVFLDPPFNQGERYEHGDNNPEYLMHLAAWIGAAGCAIKKNGSVWLNLPDEWIAEAVCNAKEAGLDVWNWCIWHYRFAQCQRSHFLRSKTHAVWLANNPIVNADAVLVPSDRAAIYNDVRTYTSTTPGERMDFDVWGFEPYWGRVQGNNKERRSLHANQLPEKYLERVIRVCTNPGDLVIDPFGGSGTTAVVAQALGRRCITCDNGYDTATSIWERVQIGAIRV